MNRATHEKCSGAIWGTFIGDALALPDHWYFLRAARHHDRGILRDHARSRNPHPDSMLWRSACTPLNERGNIPLALAIEALACRFLVRYGGQQV